MSELPIYKGSKEAQWVIIPKVIHWSFESEQQTLTTSHGLPLTYGESSNSYNPVYLPKRQSL